MLMNLSFSSIRLNYWETQWLNPAPNQTNGILKNAKIAAPLKYLSTFWRTLEIPLVNLKAELKLRWTKHCVLPVLGSANADDDDGANSNNIIFTIKDKLYVLVVTLSAEDNQKLSKFLSKGSERSVYSNEYKTKSEIKNATNEYRHFLESNFVGVKRLFVLVYLNRSNDVKLLFTKMYYQNYNAIMERTFMTNPLILI